MYRLGFTAFVCVHTVGWKFQPTVWRTQIELEILKHIAFDVRLGFTTHCRLRASGSAVEA